MVELRTYIYAVEATSAGPKALGCGLDPESARLDAIGRMRVRHKSLHTGSASLEQVLLKKLLAGNAKIVGSINASFPSQSELGHEFMSHDTYRLAQSLSSSSEAHELVAKAVQDSDQETAINAIHKAYKGTFCLKEQVDARLVDWSEVLGAIAGEDWVDVQAQKNLNLIRDDLGVEPVKGRAISPDVLEVLKSCTVDGVNVRMPEGRLERKLYERVNDVLVALGGKWVGRKVMAHVFAEDPTAVLDVAIGTGSFVKPQDFGYFPTQPQEVDRVIELADLRPGQRALEPSAGQGAIAIEMARALGFDSVDVVELLPGNAGKLREAGFKSVSQTDFLSIEPNPIYDVIVMNPPFGGMADVAHIQHAARFLKPDGRLVAITSPSWTFHSSRKAQAFREFVEESEGAVEEVAAGAFRAAGTTIATRIVTLEAVNFPWNREAQPIERMRA